MPGLKIARDVSGAFAPELLLLPLTPDIEFAWNSRRTIRPFSHEFRNCPT
jgi:hypothetical protein